MIEVYVTNSREWVAAVQVLERRISHSDYRIAYDSYLSCKGMGEQAGDDLLQAVNAIASKATP